MTQIDGLQFGEYGHRYTYRGKPILSVTQVLTLAGYRQPAPDPPSPSFILARNIGIAVHEATRLHDEGKLDMCTVDDRIKGHCASWYNFLDDSAISVEAVEKHVLIRYGNLYVAGRIDRVLRIRLGHVAKGIFDIKTGSSVSSDTGLQLAGYALGEANGGAVRDLLRFAVHLRPDGTYNPIPYSDYVDFDLFRAAIVTGYGKLRLGISKIEDTF